MPSFLNQVYPKKEILLLGFFLFVVCITTSIVYQGVSLKSVPVETREVIRLRWAPLRVGGFLFILSMFLQLVLLMGLLATWYHYPRARKVFLSLWLVFVTTFAWLAFQSLELFPNAQQNPLFFNWRFKWILLAIITLMSTGGGWLISRQLDTIRSLKDKESSGKAVDDIEDVKTQYPLLKKYPHLGAEDQAFLIRCIQLTQSNISNQHLSCKFLANELFISEQTFRRRLQKTIDMTPGTFIRTQRLIQAKEYEEKGKISAQKELAVAVGFKSTTYAVV